MQIEPQLRRTIQASVKISDVTAGESTASGPHCGSSESLLRTARASRIEPTLSAPTDSGPLRRDTGIWQQADASRFTINVAREPKQKTR